MKKILLSAAVISFLLTGSAFAAEKPKAQNANANDFQATKNMIVKNLEERIDMLQREKACVEATKSDEDLNICREKFKEERKEMLDKIKMDREKKKGSVEAPK